jgi:hypothetical protein
MAPPAPSLGPPGGGNVVIGGTMRRFVTYKATVRPGLGWQLWNPAALPLLALPGSFTVQPPNDPTEIQRELVSGTLACLKHVQRLGRFALNARRGAKPSARWHLVLSARIDRLRRAIELLSQAGIDIWWRQSGNQFEIWFILYHR